MTEPWIPRTLEPLIQTPARGLELFPVWLLLGPRQVGKSSLFLHCRQAGRKIVNLDDIETRGRVHQDPILFCRELVPPLLLDEVQYAPQLLSHVKVIADRDSRPGVVWMTGSQNFEVMAGVRESLAGRVAILQLLGLSDEEKHVHSGTPAEYFAALVGSTFPRLHGVDDPEARALYLSSYTTTYIERDVRELLGIEKRREFEVFVKMCALRTGQVVNYADLARDAGISPATARTWLGLLEDSFLIKLVHPYLTNRTRRLVKSPKLYFLDMGLAAHLAGWRDPEMLRLGPMAGAAFETHVLGQILRFFRHRARDVEICFWRTRHGQEIDFLIESRGRCLPVEIKMGLPDPRDLVPLSQVRDPHWEPGVVVSLARVGVPGAVPLHEDWMVMGPDSLKFD